MAFVIGTPCIGVKDMACLDACPTDAIHAYPDSPQLYIEPATCIDCAACESACPVKAIYPGDQVPAAEKKFIAINSDFFKTFDKAKSIAYLRGAKKEEGKAEATAGASGEESATSSNWVEKEGWETVWQEHKNRPVDRLEEQKRYGRVRAIYELPDRYIMRVFLPERTPNHPFTYRYGLGEEMCTYDVKADLKTDGKLLVKGKMADPKIAKLSGHANSFPDRFLIEYRFEKPVSSVSVSSKGKHVVDVVVSKAQEKGLEEAA